MFDFGFSELVVIAVVTLIVVGPERLPKVARTAGHLLGRLQRYVSDVKSDIQREMQLEDLKKLQQQVQQQARDLETSVRSQLEKVETDFGQTTADVRSGITGLQDSVQPGQPASAPVPPAAAAVVEAQLTPVISPEGAAPAASAHVDEAQLPLGLERPEGAGQTTAGKA